MRFPGGSEYLRTGGFLGGATTRMELWREQSQREQQAGIDQPPAIHSAPLLGGYEPSAGGNDLESFAENFWQQRGQIGPASFEVR